MQAYGPHADTFMKQPRILHVSPADKFLPFVQRVYEGRRSSWAYIWWLTCWSHSMLAINPSVNLLRNTGFGAGATHTPDSDH